MKKLLVLIFILSALENCGKKGDEGKKSSGSDAIINYSRTILVSSPSQTFSATTTLPTPQECSASNSGGLSRDIYTATGFCLTPLNFEGYTGGVGLSATSATVTNSNDPDVLADSKGVRIFGLDELVEEKGAINPGKVFDLSNLDSAGFVGNNTLWKQYSYKASYEYLSMELGYEKIKFNIKDKFVTMIIATQSQPFASSDELSACGFAADVVSQDRFKNADVLTGMSFKRGDYLFCVKDTQDETCAATDYKWLDLDAMSLVSTRPTNPKMYKWVEGDVTCEVEKGSEHENSFTLKNFTGLREAAKFSADDAFKLYADFSHGNLSQQWKDAERPFGDELDPSVKTEVESLPPFLLYYYEKGAEKTSGTTLKTKFTIDLSGALFFDGLDKSNLGDVSLEQALKSVYTIGGWVAKKKFEGNVQGTGPEQYYGMSAVPEITVSGDKGKPEITSIETE